VPGRTVQPIDIAPTPQPQTTTGGPAAPSAEDAAPDYSTTNNQEAGVDEPDIVKTDGKTLFTVAGDTVYALSVRGESKIVGSLKLDGYSGQLMLRGHKLVAIVEQGSVVYDRPGRGARADPVRLRQDRADRDRRERSRRDEGAAPACVRRLVRRRTPERGDDPRGPSTRRRWPTPRPARSIRRAGWLPRSHFISNVTHRKRTRSYVPCNRVSRTPAFSGLGMLSIVTLNLDKGLWQEDSDGVMTDAQTVYGSTKHLYVATQRWIDPSTPATDLPSGTTTLISRFDVTDPDRTSYEGSGSVPGYLLNQYLAVGERRRPARRRPRPSPSGGTARSRSRAARWSRCCAARTSTRSDRSTGSATASGSTRCGSPVTSATSSRSARSTRCT
jgi:hypothetical protein